MFPFLFAGRQIETDRETMLADEIDAIIDHHA